MTGTDRDDESARRADEGPRRDHGADPRADEEAGGRESFADAALYDFEYRRRRADVTFYRRLAADRMGFGEPGPVLDLACGTGRLLVPLVRDGHAVAGVDLSAAMLARAAQRVRRLPVGRRSRALLVRADLRAFSFAPRFALALAAFHSVQHLVSDADLLAFFRCARASAGKAGWLAFDVLPPDPRWLGRDPDRRWARTVFRHPETRERLVYTMDQRYDAERRALHMRIYYQPVDAEGRPAGEERVVRLCHRQLSPSEIGMLLAATGWKLIDSFGGFDGRPLTNDGSDDEHVYVARAI